MQQSDDMTERLMSLFQNREFELSEAGRFAADQDAMAADEERARHREAATTWRRSLGAGDTVPGHDAYDYEAMARDEVWPKPDGAGRVPLSPRYWKPGRMVLAGHDLATGQRVLSRVPLEERVMSDMPEDEPGAENIEAILAQATPEDFAELSPVERRALDAWMESQGVQVPGVMVAAGPTATKTDAMPAERVGSPFAANADMRELGRPIEGLFDMLAGALKGGVAQTLGLPGDIESLVRMLTGGEQVMPTTEDMEKKLPPAIPPSVTDLVTGGDRLRQVPADVGQTLGEFGGLGKAPGMAAGAVKQVIKKAAQ